MSDKVVISAGPRALLLLMRAGSGLLAAIAAWWRTRCDERFLLEQPETRLRDIGIGRQDIARVIRAGAQGAKFAQGTKFREPGDSRPGP